MRIRVMAAPITFNPHHAVMMNGEIIALFWSWVDADHFVKSYSVGAFEIVRIEEGSE